MFGDKSAQKYQYAGYNSKQHSLSLFDEFDFIYYDIIKWKLCVQGLVFRQDIKHKDPVAMQMKNPIVMLSNEDPAKVRELYAEFQANSVDNRCYYIRATEFEGDCDYRTFSVEFMVDTLLDTTLNTSLDTSFDQGIGSSCNSVNISRPTTSGISITTIPKSSPCSSRALSRSSSFTSSTSGKVTKSGKGFVSKSSLLKGISDETESFKKKSFLKKIQNDPEEIPFYSGFTLTLT